MPFVLATALIAKDPARFGFDVVPDPPLAWETVTREEAGRPRARGRAHGQRRCPTSSSSTASSARARRRTASRRTNCASPPARRLSWLPGSRRFPPRPRSPRSASSSGRARRLQKIARRAGVSVAELCDWNDLPRTARPKKGTVLVVPAKRGTAPPRAALAVGVLPRPGARSAASRRPRPPSRRRRTSGPSRPSRRRPPRPTRPRAGILPPSRFPRKASSTRRATAPGRARRRSVVRHTVKTGDTLYAIASRYGVSVDEIQRQNRIRSPQRAPGRADSRPLARHRELKPGRMTVARAYSAAVAGLEGRTVVVEAAIGAGLPGLTIVGPPGRGREGKPRAHPLGAPARRISGALEERRRQPRARGPSEVGHGAGPRHRARDSRRERRPARRGSRDGVTLVGELALDGELRPVPGVLSFAETSRREGRALLVPTANAEEAAAVPSLHVFAAPHLGAAIAHLLAREVLPRVVPSAAPRPPPGSEPDLADVRGQAVARRALEIAAAGGHNILFSGPPGSGKTMLARRLPGILPPLSREESLEVDAHLERRGPPSRGKRTPRRAPVPLAPSRRVGGGARGRRRRPAPRGALARALRSSLPRRAARVPEGRARGAARASRRRRRLRRAGGRGADVSRPDFSSSAR